MSDQSIRDYLRLYRGTRRPLRAGRRRAGGLRRQDPQPRSRSRRAAVSLGLAARRSGRRGRGVREHMCWPARHGPDHRRRPVAGRAAAVDWFTQMDGYVGGDRCLTKCCSTNRAPVGAGCCRARSRRWPCCSSTRRRNRLPADRAAVLPGAVVEGPLRSGGGSRPRSTSVELTADSLREGTEVHRSRVVLVYPETPIAPKSARSCMPGRRPGPSAN